MKKLITILIMILIFLPVVFAESSLCNHKWGLASLKAMNDVYEEITDAECIIDKQKMEGPYLIEDKGKNYVHYCNKTINIKDSIYPYDAVGLESSVFPFSECSQTTTTDAVTKETIKGYKCTGQMCIEGEGLYVPPNMINQLKEDINNAQEIFICRTTCVGGQPEKWNMAPWTSKVQMWLLGIKYYFE